MAETAVSADLLETLQVLAQLVVQEVRCDLRVLAVLDVLLSVEEPVGDLVLTWVRDDGDETVDLLLAQLTGSLAGVHVGLAQHHMSESSAHTLDGC